MNPNIEALLSFLSSHSQGMLKLISITFLGVVLLVRYLDNFKVLVGLKTILRGNTRKLPDPDSWRAFFQMIICMVVYAALAWLLMLAG